jgi:hypothetical protein
MRQRESEFEKAMERAAITREGKDMRENDIWTCFKLRVSRFFGLIK